MLIMDILKPCDYSKASETCKPDTETLNFNTEHHCVDKQIYWFLPVIYSGVKDAVRGYRVQELVNKVLENYMGTWDESEEDLWFSVT